MTHKIKIFVIRFSYTKKICVLLYLRAGEKHMNAAFFQGERQGIKDCCDANITLNPVIIII